MHLVGKDILTTHAVYWSTILMALGHALPTTLFAHGWWTVEGEKMSKSRGNVVDPNTIVDEFGVDAFRYFLLREVPFGQDGDFSKDAMIGRINSELANDLGNLLNRSLTMIERFAGGAVPSHAPAADTEMEHRLRKTINGLFASAERHITNLEFNRALEAVWELVQLSNQYIDKSAPWTLAKKAEDKARLDTVLYHGAETLRILSLALYPFMPQTTQEMVRQLGLTVDLSNPNADELNWGYLKPGTKIAKGRPLFPRIETTAKTQGGTSVTQDQQPASPPTDQITIDEFRKVSLRIGKVVAAERVPKSTKLLKLQVDIGTEQRQIVAGIAMKYAPEDMIGKRVVIVANMKPAKLMGVESQGMVLAAGEEEVSALLTTMEDVPPGSKIK
jgi:methionyl-tRNA synthetase